MKKFAFLVLMILLLAVSACAGSSPSGMATPITTLKHPRTGVVVTCGGNISEEAAQDNVWLVGPLGVYMIEKNKANTCVKKYMADGYEPV